MKYSLLLLGLLALPTFAQRNYHPISIKDMAAENPAHWKKLHTHVSVSGWLTYKKKEADGDWHLRICDAPDVKGMARDRCIVAECVPELPCDPPKIGSQVTVKGIYRYDAELGHRFAEVHPVESLKVVKN